MNNRGRAYQIEVAITNELKKNLEGRWPAVLSAILPEIAEAISKGEKHHILCPYHQADGRKRDRNQFDFRISDDFAKSGGCFCTCNKKMTNGFQVIMYARNCSFMEAKTLVIEQLGGRLTTTHLPHTYVKEVDPREQERVDADLKRKITRYWDQALPIHHPDATVARLYFENRGLTDVRMPLHSVRLHPSLGYYHDGKKLGDFPALICMARNIDGKTSTIHRTYLEPDGSGKARQIIEAGLDARKQYTAPSSHPVNGCAIKLDIEEHPALNAGEGLETMLGVRMLAPVPTWSLLNKTLLEQMEIPSYVKILTVWADRDRSGAGQESAVKLVERARAKGIRAIVMLPPFAIPDGEKGLDWNDVVRDHGIEVMRRNMKFLEWKRRLMQILAEIRNQSPRQLSAVS